MTVASGMVVDVEEEGMKRPEAVFYLGGMKRVGGWVCKDRYRGGMGK
jgi:hypothetical protein